MMKLGNQAGRRMLGKIILIGKKKLLMLFRHLGKISGFQPFGDCCGHSSDNKILPQIIQI